MARPEPAGPTKQRELPTQEARDLLALTRELALDELAPRAAADERQGRFPRDVLRTLGQAGLLGLPYAQESGGGGQPYVVYLQVVEELATAWLAVAGSVHVLSCHPLATYGSSEQRERWLPEMVGGDLLGAYCLSEPQAGSDAGSLQTRAVRQGDGSAAEYVVDGVKAWITHAGVADYYNLMVRTGEPGARGISCLLAPADPAGLTVAPRERLMGLRASPVAQVNLDGARVPADRLLGQEGQGFTIAMSALDGTAAYVDTCASDHDARMRDRVSGEPDGPAAGGAGGGRRRQCARSRGRASGTCGSRRCPTRSSSSRRT